MRGKTFRKIISVFLLSLLVSSSVILFARTDLMKSFELRSLDACFRLRSRGPFHESIQLIGIDDFARKILGKWPWPRKVHAAFLNALSKFPPSVVGFDLLFVERDKKDLEGDLAMVSQASLFDHLVLGASVRIDDFKTMDYAADEIKDIPDTLKETTRIGKVSGSLDDLPQAHDPLLPFSELLKVSEFAFLNASRDLDGVVRKVPMVIRYKNDLYPTFPLRIVLDYYDVKPGDVTLNLDSGLLMFNYSGGEAVIPVNSSGYMLINYRGQIKDFPAYSYIQFLQVGNIQGRLKKEVLDPKDFLGKLVIIGLLTTRGTDTGSTSLSSNAALVEVHLNAVNTILLKDFIRKISPLSQVVLILLVSVFSGFIAGFLRKFLALLGTCFLLVLFIGLGIWLFIFASFWLSMISPLLAILLSFSIVTFYRFLAEEKEKRWIKNAFKHYLPDNVMTEILEDPSRLKLGGERKTLSVLFSDIRGFTTYCENRSPESIVSLLNEIMDRMTAVIMKWGGTLDKYVGDQIVAFFGAPSKERQEDHAERAVIAALEMVSEMKKLHYEWKKREIELMCMGIGINSGEMVVGNMGSSKIMDYTVIGSEVNLGARMEALTRKFNVDILISENTRNLLGENAVVKDLGVTQVKGFDKEIRVFELQDFESDITKEPGF
ncbi:MAG: CHASE2 domain-containing protein [Candidatus Theseobacter exili]|nr:CHASE2 domain-containing protein [Candidatus Theseobacter exili]